MTPRPLKRSADRVVVSAGRERLASLRVPGWLGPGHEELRFQGRRYRLDRPDDRRRGERFAELARGFFGWPTRRVVWRSGAGIATEVTAARDDYREASGDFRLDDVAYRVRCRRDGPRRQDLHRQLYRDGLLVAELEPSVFTLRESFLKLHRPMPLDALAVAVHLMLWLQADFGGGGGHAGGGGGGGGGDGGGGC